MAKKPTIFYNGKTWSYGYKILNKNLKEKYRVKGGYQTHDEAEKAFYVHQQRRNEDENGLILNQRNTMPFAEYLDWMSRASEK